MRKSDRDEQRPDRRERPDGKRAEAPEQPIHTTLDRSDPAFGAAGTTNVR